MPPRRTIRGGDTTPRWQDPDLDAAALAVARLVRDALAVLEQCGDVRWRTWLAGTVAPLEDGGTREVAAAARRVRAAFGTADSVLDVWPGERALRLRDMTDRLLRVIDARLGLGRRQEAG